MDPDRPNPELPRSRNIAAITLAVVLVCIAAVGNSLITLLLFNVGDEFVNCLFCGMLIAQPCVLSTWCASVKQRLMFRVSLSMGILLALFFLYLITLRSQERMPLEVPLVCFGIVVGLSLMIQIPLFLLRRFTNHAISIGQSALTDNSGKQFGIKHLMIATTIVAVLVFLAQKVFARLGFAAGREPWVEILTFIASLAVLTSVISLLCVGLVFLRRVRIASGIGLVMVVFLGSYAVYWILTTASGFSSSFSVFYNTTAFAIALAVTINSVLVSFYALGNRMQKLNPGN